MTDKPTYFDCFIEDMSVIDAARAIGVSESCVRQWASRNGVKFPDGRKMASASERMWAMQADPSFNPLRKLTPEQRADFDALRKAKLSRAEALQAIGVSL